MIRNINEKYGEAVIFEDTDGMADSIRACGYEVEARDLVEGVDFEVVGETSQTPDTHGLRLCDYGRDERMKCAGHEPDIIFPSDCAHTAVGFCLHYDPCMGKQPLGKWGTNPDDRADPELLGGLCKYFTPMKGVKPS